MDMSVRGECNVADSPFVEDDYRRRRLNRSVVQSHRRMLAPPTGSISVSLLKYARADGTAEVALSCAARDVRVDVIKAPSRQVSG